MILVLELSVRSAPQQVDAEVEAEGSNAPETALAERQSFTWTPKICKT